MARQLNVAPFRKFLRQIEGQVLRTSQKFVEARMKRIEQTIMALNQSFWPGFITATINTSGPPNLNEFTPKWKPLAKSYLKKKLKQGKGFYFYTGALNRSLSQARPSILGKPVIQFTNIPKRVAAGESFRFTIDPMPRLSGLRGTALLNAIDGSTTQRSMKLSNFRGSRNRNIFEPYVMWYMKYVVTPRVLRDLK